MKDTTSAQNSSPKKYRIRVVDSGIPSQDGQFLKGPMDPAQVRKLGYSFTEKAEEAWTFLSRVEASMKIKALTRHFGSGVFEWEEAV